MVAGETSKGAARTVLTPSGEVQSVGVLLMSSEPSLKSSQVSSMDWAPLPVLWPCLPCPVPLPFEVGR
eukprot:3816612-Alexandrium_andersonii.AAC.1